MLKFAFTMAIISVLLDITASQVYVDPSRRPASVQNAFLYDNYKRFRQRIIDTNTQLNTWISEKRREFGDVYVAMCRAHKARAYALWPKCTRAGSSLTVRYCTCECKAQRVWNCYSPQFWQFFRTEKEFRTELQRVTYERRQSIGATELLKNIEREMYKAARKQQPPTRIGRLGPQRPVHRSQPSPVLIDRPIEDRSDKLEKEDKTLRIDQRMGENKPDPLDKYAMRRREDLLKDAPVKQRISPRKGHSKSAKGGPKGAILNFPRMRLKLDAKAKPVKSSKSHPRRSKARSQRKTPTRDKIKPSNDIENKKSLTSGPIKHTESEIPLKKSQQSKTLQQRAKTEIKSASSKSKDSVDASEVHLNASKSKTKLIKAALSVLPPISDKFESADAEPVTSDTVEKLLAISPDREDRSLQSENISNFDVLGSIAPN